MSTAVIFAPDMTHPATMHIVTAIAVFCAWFNYLLHLQRYELLLYNNMLAVCHGFLNSSTSRFNSFGIYVVMFLEILSTLLRVLFVFSVLIIAFGLSFHILLQQIVI